MEYQGYKIEREPNYFMVEIKPIGRGSVHLSLRGYFQTHRDAMKAIDDFIRKEGSDG